MPDSLYTTVVTFLRDHQGLAEPIVFVLGFAEGIPLISLFVPSSALFLAIASLQGALGGGFWWMWLSAAGGAMLGDCATYAIGRRFKHEVQNVWPFSRYPDWLRKGRALLERWGWLAVLGGKFLGFLRPFVPAAAGVAEMPIPLFLLASALSSLAWAGVFLAPGFGLSLLLE
jgi:membrane protein DedA with SNARE-associated domain